MISFIRFQLSWKIVLTVLAIYGVKLLLPPPYMSATDGKTLSYSRDIQPILESRCVFCHGVYKIRNRLDLQSYESLMAGSKNGAVIIPGDAENSLLIQKIIKGEMPKRGPKMFPTQLHKIIDWINAGALNN